MKIVLVSFRFDTSSGAVLVPRLLARELARRGWRVTVVAGGPQSGVVAETQGNIKHYRFRPKNLYWVGEKDDQPVWKKMIWQMFDVWNPHVYSIVRRILVAERPDIVHVHKLRGLSPSVWTASAHAGVSRLVQTCHDYEVMSPEGTLTTRVGRLASRHALALRPYQAVRRRLSNRVDAVTAPSDYTLQMVTEHGFFDRARRATVPNSHGLTRTELEAIGQDERHRTASGSDVRLLYLGRLEKSKGVETLCMAFDRASRDRDNLNLVIAGWGPLLQRLLERYSDHPRVRVAGPVYGRDKDELLRTSTALVVPSEWDEVFGIVIVEGFTRGCPVIASSVGGIPEIVDDGETGVLVRPFDTEGLASAFRQIADFPDRFAAMRSRCRWAARAYCVEDIADRYVSVYDSLEPEPVQ